VFYNFRGFGEPLEQLVTGVSVLHVQPAPSVSLNLDKLNHLKAIRVKQQIVSWSYLTQLHFYFICCFYSPWHDIEADVSVLQCVCLGKCSQSRREHTGTRGSIITRETEMFLASYLIGAIPTDAAP